MQQLFDKVLFLQKIEHSVDKITGYFENELGHEVLQFSVQQTCILEEIQTTRIELTHNQWRTKR